MGNLCPEPRNMGGNYEIQALKMPTSGNKVFKLALCQVKAVKDKTTNLE